MSDYSQVSFSGGIDLINDDSHLASDAYVWLINARQRLGFIKPNFKNIKLTDLPSGLKQGLHSVGNIMIIFISGKAFYREEDSGNPWIQIPGFLMSSTASEFFTETVPASTFNYVRKLDVGLSIHSPIRATTDFEVAGTPAGILVQDGINQPWIIEYDPANQIFTSRVTKNYNQWQNVSSAANDREYVPIGLNMMFKDGILHIVSPTKKYAMRSITGRPLDFMMNVDENGNKAPSETIGGAITTSYAMDFDDITCLREIDVPDSFVYGTKHNTRIITADYTQTIFGEPLFRVASTIRGSGIVNQYCFTESLNDFVFISLDSAKSFNAVQQLKFKGNSSIFSKQLQYLLQNPTTKQAIKQVDCSCIGFQNYVLFNIDTLWGNLVAVYDTLLDKFVSLDITEAVRVKRYCTIETELEIRLYCITQHNDMFQLYGDTTQTEVAELRVKSFTSQITTVEHKSAHLRPFFVGGTFDGKVYVTEYVDEQLSVDAQSSTNDIDYRYAQDLKSSYAGIPFPVIPPVMPNNKQRIDLPGFPITNGLNGKKLSFVLQWTNDSALVELQLQTSEQSGQTSMKQKDLTNKQSYE